MNTLINYINKTNVIIPSEFIKDKVIMITDIEYKNENLSGIYRIELYSNKTDRVKQVCSHVQELICDKVCKGYCIRFRNIDDNTEIWSCHLTKWRIIKEGVIL